MLSRQTTRELYIKLLEDLIQRTEYESLKDWADDITHLATIKRAQETGEDAKLTLGIYDLIDPNK